MVLGFSRISEASTIQDSGGGEIHVHVQGTGATSSGDLIVEDGRIVGVEDNTTTRPTLGCALFSESEKVQFPLNPNVLPSSRRFQAPSFTDSEGGECVFKNVKKGKYYVAVVVERDDARRDLSLTFSDNSKPGWIPEDARKLMRKWVVPYTPQWVVDNILPRWMVEELVKIPQEEWAVSRKEGLTREARIDTLKDPPRPFKEESVIRFPGRGVLNLTFKLRRET